MSQKIFMSTLRRLRRAVGHEPRGDASVLAASSRRDSRGTFGSRATAKLATDAAYSRPFAHMWSVARRSLSASAHAAVGLDWDAWQPQSMRFLLCFNVGLL